MGQVSRFAGRTSAMVALWGAIVVVALAIGVYAKAPQMPGVGAGRMVPRVPGPAPDLPALLWALGVGSIMWFAAALMLPLLVWGARAIDLERLGRVRAIAFVATVIVVLVAGTSFVDYAITYRGLDERPGLTRYVPVALRQNLLPWLALTAIVGVVETRRRARRATVERERLRAEVAEQRLIALTGQLHPHFLFNTLQSISTLVHRDPNAAEEMLAKLADLLRDLLRTRDRVLVPLQDELRYVRTYLEISQVRFGERLSFDISVPADLNGFLVPLFIMQPLVENALAHGVGGTIRGGRVSLRAARSGDCLALEVEDDGAGLGAAPIRERIGLTNTRERLRASFGDDQRLTVAPRAGGGTIARIEMPARPA